VLVVASEHGVAERGVAERGVAERVGVESLRPRVQPSAAR
jgi:hypothetical protein